MQINIKFITSDDLDPLTICLKTDPELCMLLAIRSHKRFFDS